MLGPTLIMRCRLRLRLHPLDRLAVLHRIAPAAALRVRRLRAVHRAVRQRALVDGPEEPGHLRHSVHQRLPGDRIAARDPARSAHPRRRLPARDLPVPDGAVVHRHRHGVEVDPQSRAWAWSTWCGSWGFENFTFDWIVTPGMSIYTVVIAGVWQSSGFVMALFLAGLRGIDDSIIKAAQVDGASTGAHLHAASSSRRCGRCSSARSSSSPTSPSRASTW